MRRTIRRRTPQRLWATYHLVARTRAQAAHRAQLLVVEQTVEMPRRSVPPAARGMVGTVRSLERAGPARWRVRCAYRAELIGGSVAQLVNLLFGNLSLLRGIRLVDLRLPAAVANRFPGPAFGIAGWRALCGAQGRPLLGVAIKPVGLSAAALAQWCYRFAAAGVDVVKDDHSLADQQPAPFRDRVARCLEAVARANQRTGGGTLYVPHWTPGAENPEACADWLCQLGCRAVLLGPMLAGFEVVAQLAARGQVAILAHPTLTGALLHPSHGIAAEVLYGVLFRLLGSDGVIYPNAGGRFPWRLETALAVARRLRGRLGRLRPALPVLAGGVDPARVPHWIRRYGPDTMFLLGSGLYAQSDPAGAAARLVDSIRRWSDVP